MIDDETATATASRSMARSAQIDGRKLFGNFISPFILVLADTYGTTERKRPWNTQKTFCYVSHSALAETVLPEKMSIINHGYFSDVRVRA